MQTQDNTLRKALDRGISLHRAPLCLRGTWGLQMMEEGSRNEAALSDGTP